jgi:outer membrane protein assembly factor BamB
MSIDRIKLAGLALGLLAGSSTARGFDDWNQWMGPNRDNVWREEGLIDKFPKDGPKVLWRTPVAIGYSGPAVVKGKVYITDYETSDNVKDANFGRAPFQGKERVHCLDEATGKVLWSHSYPVQYAISYPSGPRCTPNVDNGKVYTLGAEGHLFCFDATTGAVLWSKELKKEYETTSALWGYSAHPLIDGNNLITLAGGPGRHIVALDKNTGKEVWRSSTAPEQGYSPPTIINAGGVRQLILCKPNGVSSINPESGQEYWNVPYEATSGSIIMSPIQIDEYLYVAGYSKKSLLLKLDSKSPKAEIVWRDKGKTAISPVNVQPLAVGDVIYGMDQGGELVALKIPSGDRLWESTATIVGRKGGSETTFLVKEQNRFWLFNEKGELLIAKLTPQGYEEIDRAKIVEPTNNAFGRDVVWSMPAFANKRAYIRNDKEIVCVDLKK